MAEYHLSAQMIGRSGGRSAVAAAAYRSGQRLTSGETGELFDFTRKQHVESAEVLAPTASPAWALDRQQLWAAVEAQEARKNSQFAREIEVSIPRGLTAEQGRALVRQWALDNLVRHGVVADLAIHAPQGHDGLENRHAHIMVTTRRLAPDGSWEKGKARDLDGKDQLQEWRASWATACNKALVAAGKPDLARLDHRSFADRGLAEVPTQHEGPRVTQARRRGRRTEIADRNDMVRARRAAIAREQNRIMATSTDLALRRQIATAQELGEAAQFLAWSRQDEGGARLLRTMDGRTVHDRGDRLTTDNGGSTQAVAVMIAAARAKGWTSITVSGSQAFQAAAAAEAARAGLRLAEGASPVATAAWEAARRQQTQVQLPTPAPPPPSPEAALDAIRQRREAMTAAAQAEATRLDQLARQQAQSQRPDAGAEYRARAVAEVAAHARRQRERGQEEEGYQPETPKPR